MTKGSTKLARGVAWITDHRGKRKSVDSLADALAAETNCGCGIECECYGYVTLPVYDTTTGEVVGFGALYLTSSDGGATVDGNFDTKEGAEAAIEALKAL